MDIGVNVGKSMLINKDIAYFISLEPILPLFKCFFFASISIFCILQLYDNQFVILFADAAYRTI